MTFALIGNFTRLVSLETMNNSNLPKIGSAPPGRLTQHIRRPETSSRKDRHQTSISAAAAAPGVRHSICIGKIYFVPKRSERILRRKGECSYLYCLVICGVFLCVQAMVQNVEDIMTTGRILTCTPETPLDNGVSFCPFEEAQIQHKVMGTGTHILPYIFLCVQLWRFWWNTMSQVSQLWMRIMWSWGLSPILIC